MKKFTKVEYQWDNDLHTLCLNNITVQEKKLSISCLNISKFTITINVVFCSKTNEIAKNLIIKISW